MSVYSGEGEGYQLIADPRLKEWVYDCFYCGNVFLQGPTTGPNTGAGNMGQSYGLSIQCPKCGSTNTSGPRKLTDAEEFIFNTTPTEKDLSPVVHKQIESILANDLSEGSLNNLVDAFDYETVAAWSPAQQSFMWQLLDRVNKTSDWVTFKVEAENVLNSADDEGQNYVVWQTAEDEATCDYCAPLDMKIVSTDELDSLDQPPAHVNCRCTLIPISDRYGKDVPILYYHSIPISYDQWHNMTEQLPLRTERIELSYNPALQKLMKFLDDIEHAQRTNQEEHTPDLHQS